MEMEMEMEVIISENSQSVDGRVQKESSTGWIDPSQKRTAIREAVVDSESRPESSDCERAEVEDSMRRNEAKSKAQINQRLGENDTTLQDSCFGAPHVNSSLNPLPTSKTNAISTTSAALDTPPKATTPKKPKRSKRGLERELEQLDYWGRRKAREAKKRRRTLTSRLVGVFEESEYLTWAHVIRSFIPPGLLNHDECSTRKEPVGIKENDKTLIADSNPLETEKESTQIEKDNAPEAKTAWQEENLESLKFLKQFSGLLGRSQWTREELEIGEFLHELKQNGGILHVMQRCLDMLLKKYNRAWPRQCALAYKELYLRIRRHITVGATLSHNEDSQRLLNFAVAALVNIELLLSLSNIQKCISSSSKSDFCFRSNDDRADFEKLLADESLHLDDDLFHLQLLLSRPDVWKEQYLQAHLRLAWIQSQIKLIAGLPEEAVFHLQMLIEQMTLSTREDEESLKVDACQIEDDTVELALTHFQNQLNIIQRSQMLEKIEAKFAAGHYHEVIQILISIFDDSLTRIEADGRCPPRHAQLLILLESLVKTGNMKGVIHWGSFCLKEAVDYFQGNESIDDERKKWAEVIRMMLLLVWDGYLAHMSEVSGVSEEQLGKLISSLVNILVIQLEHGSSLSLPYFNTLTPWMILHRTLSQYERKQVQRSSQNVAPQKPNEDLSEQHDDLADKDALRDTVASPASSTLLLITAHEELGKNKWCCVEEGRFLLYMLDVLLVEFKRPLSEEQKQVVHQSVEQIMFCLFSHPSRKTKVSLLYCKYKHLRDHGGQPIPLTWMRALQLYKYYLPHQLPGFQSSQLPSITDDVAVLFRRIISLMPDVFKHPDQTRGIEAYIEGELLPSGLLPLDFPEELKDCYYLLADSYFKGKEWEQAIHYYKLDVSVNSNRIDSWAPMGLAKKAQLETLLNSCEVIRNDEEFFRESQRACRCLDRVLQLDQYFSILWVEKGGLVYMIHSHASRLLKQELNPDMSIEMFESLEKIKSEMLKEASVCFCEASKIVEEGWDDEELPDERWLYQYMLGKLAEKTGKSPAEVLGHYLDAFRRLHAIGAKYPTKINYNNPPEFSVEALEVFFRINVYIFKYINQMEGKDIEPHVLKLFKNVIAKLAVSPFVLLKERQEVDYALEVTDFKGPLDRNETSDKRKTQDDVAPSKKQKTSEDNKAFIENLIYKSVDEALDTSLGKDKQGNDGIKAPPEESSGVNMEECINKEREELVRKCVNSFELCVTRFPHHYKSLYRLAYFYHYSKSHKDNIKARNILLGSDDWQQLHYMPSSGLFSERKVSPMNPKNSNLFNGVWRIPHDEIDRPGSFAAHMYRCVSLCLDILQETKDFYTILEIAIALRNSPDKDKKYLRDNERELLSEHATLVGIQTMKDKFRGLFMSSSSPPPKSKCHSFLVDVYKAYRQMSRHLPASEISFSKMLVDAYATLKCVPKENNPNLLREAENFCIRNPSFHAVSSVGSNISYSSGLKITSAVPSMLSMARRGRPPGPSRDFGSHRFRTSQDTPPTMGQTLAVQQAYKVYENLIQAQTILNNKTLDEKRLQYYRGKYEEYKQQMLKYLQIQSVSQFFHSSLQSLGTSTAKLPPPASSNLTKNVSEISSPSPTTVSLSQGKHTLSSLSARSKVHGISISAVTKRTELSATKPMKPTMSITMSQSKLNTTTAFLIDKASASIVSKDMKNSSHVSGSLGSNLPKLPPGTTLSRQIEGYASGQRTSLTKEADKSKTKSVPSLETFSSPTKGSVTITQTLKPGETSLTKKQSVVSFQAAFQASLAKSELGSISNKNPTKERPSTSSLQQPKQGVKLSSTKHLKPGDKKWESSGKALSVTPLAAASSQPDEQSKVEEKPSNIPSDSSQKDGDDNCVIILD